MTSHRFVSLLGALAAVWLIQSAPARAQEPSAATIALGREIVELKGGIGMFDTIIDGVLEHHRQMLVQVNPNISTDLGTIIQQLRTQYVPRLPQIHTEIGRAYAIQFTESELRQILAFYKTPLGKKLIEAEPKAIDEATKRVDAWATKFADEVMAKMRDELKKKGHSL
jgi:hypothetical protein